MYEAVNMSPFPVLEHQIVLLIKEKVHARVREART